jgi:hypothetical protein
MEKYIGKKVVKKSGKPFKSNLKIATVKGIIINPDDPKHRQAFVLEEDGSIVNIDKLIVIDF